MPRGNRHGLSQTREHQAWWRMMQRCYNPNHQDWKRYGGRGISVCQKWHDFIRFFTDIGVKPSPKHSLGRIDNDGNYEPKNCRWETYSQQNRNKLNNHFVEFNGQRKCLTDWAADLGVLVTTLRYRIRKGRWTETSALGTTVRNYGKTH